MSALSIGLALAIRVVLVLLFLPFRALDKVLDFRSAVAQAEEALPSKLGATGLILVGLFVEVFMSAGVVSGVADRACAFVLAGCCAVTALVWKQFWRSGDFWSSSNGMGRALFWDFCKNLALAAGFLLIVFGTDAASIAQFFAHPTIQSHPYLLTGDDGVGPNAGYELFPADELARALDQASQNLQRAASETNGCLALQQELSPRKEAEGGKSSRNDPIAAPALRRNWQMSGIGTEELVHFN